MNKGNSPPRVAVIGISGYGRVHLQLLREGQERGELVIAAAVVINPDEEKENVAILRAQGCEIFGSYEEMFARHRGQLELCLIPTGIHWHARMTVAALHAGANVLVEKPLAGSLAEVEQIHQAELKTGRFVAVGFQDYYEAATGWLKSGIVHGTIGDLKSVRFLGIWPRPRAYFQRNDWAGRLHVAGWPVVDSAMNNAFAHFVMLSLYLAGHGADAAAASTLEGAELFRAHQIESFDTAVVRLRTRHGVGIWLGASHACQPASEPEITVHGTQGTAGWRYEREAWLRRGDTVQRMEISDITGARRAMMAAVLRRLREPAHPICTTEIAGRHVEVIDSLHRNGAISTFPPGMIDWPAGGEHGAAIPNVRGLESAMRRAYGEASSLAQAGFVLAAQPGPV